MNSMANVTKFAKPPQKGLQSKALMGRSTASLRHTLRVEHARELMGNSYKKSIVSRYEHKKDIEKNIYEIVKNRLPKNYQKRA